MLAKIGVPHSGHELQSNAEGNCGPQKSNTLQGEDYIPTKPWPLECLHLLLQKLSAPQMQNIQKNFPQGLGISLPSKANANFNRLKANWKQNSFTV